MQLLVGLISKGRASPDRVSRPNGYVLLREPEEVPAQGHETQGGCIAASSLARKHECRPIGHRLLLDALILYGFPRINDGQAGRFKGRCVA